MVFLGILRGLRKVTGALCRLIDEAGLVGMWHLDLLSGPIMGVSWGLV